MSGIHGGPDALGVPRWDFSTNANACGPCPTALAAVQAADPQHYPDPAYTGLRTALAAFHGVATERLVVAGSASEFIARFTAAVVRTGGQRVWWPALAYGDYGHAARAWGLQRAKGPAQADLLWLCEPSSPLGTAEPLAQAVAAQGGVVVLDRAYEPLRLSGHCSLSADALDRVWQLWSPNKALGLTGVRGAYAIAPPQGQVLAQTLTRMAPSWPLGAHAVAMLTAWSLPDTQRWLARSRWQLTEWKAAQRAMLQDAGWVCLPSEANHFCARAPHPLNVDAVKLRDTTSLGLPGHWRLGVLSPAAQAALACALSDQTQGPATARSATTGNHVQSTRGTGLAGPPGASPRRGEDALRRKGAFES
jgi:histidinol-phosphate aminotransferase